MRPRTGPNPQLWDPMNTLVSIRISLKITGEFFYRLRCHFASKGPAQHRTYKTKLNSMDWVRERTIPTERLSTKLVSTVEGRRCHVVSVTDPYGHILGFLDRSRYFFFKVAPQLYSRSWVDPVPDPLFLRKSGSAMNRTRTSGSVARSSDH
jgi:hypothetical protein